MINIKEMMQQAQQVQQKLAELQEKFKDIIVEGEAGGGSVKVTMTCAGDVQSVTIDPAVVNPDDKETLEDLIVAALNNANEAKDARVEQETKAMMAGMGLPEDTQLPM